MNDENTIGREEIRALLQRAVRREAARDTVQTVWGEPLVGFAAADHPLILQLKESVGVRHLLPQDVLPEARTVIAYFVPFTRELARSNRDGATASRAWAVAYEETNALFGRLNERLIAALRKAGQQAAVTPEALRFDRRLLVSNWSQRHFARAAGLGTFGLNNMLLTRHGGCGRLSTVITDLDVEPDEPLREELCLYRAALERGEKPRCGVCMRVCPAGALTPDHYDRQACYRVCRENARRFTGLGQSYADDAENGSVGSEVCGKCVVSGPCAFWKR
ncbi:MAG: epoxyqueuosine reductase [Anaerovoracaceae bacterium]|jgi:epoxyqueuosine reductase QueG